MRSRRAHEHAWYYFLGSGSVTNPILLKPAREAAKKICQQRYVEFGCSGQASKIKAMPLAQVAVRYANGELAQLVK
mgnify:CR=1 FL=1